MRSFSLQTEAALEIAEEGSFVCRSKARLFAAGQWLLKQGGGAFTLSASAVITDSGVAP